MKHSDPLKLELIILLSKTMLFTFKNLINKLLIIFCLFLFIPFIAQAGECETQGGSCEPMEFCLKSIASNVYDHHCETGEVCCDLATMIPPATATDYQEGSTGGFMLLKGHLVPCGRQTDDGGTPENETEECTLCHLFLLLKNIFDLILSLMIVTAILLITIGGVVYMVSTGNSNLTGIAKKIISKTLIGFALMLGGWLIVFTLLSFLSAGDNHMIGKETGNWFEFTCDSNSKF